MASEASGAGLAWARRALCCGAAIATLLLADAWVAAIGCTVESVCGVEDEASALLAPGTVSLVPSFSLALGSILFALASSASETWLRCAIPARVSPGLTI